VEAARFVVEEALEDESGGDVFPALEVTLRSPHGPLPPGFAGRPLLLGIRVLRHVDRRA
jgi:hypothetical protein